MDLNNEAVDITEWVISIAIVVLPTLLVLAASAWASRTTIEQLRRLWAAMRGGIVGAMDEGTDPAVVLLASILKRNPVVLAKTTKRIAEFLVKVLDEVSDKLGDEHAVTAVGRIEVDAETLDRVVRDSLNEVLRGPDEFPPGSKRSLE